MNLNTAGPLVSLALGLSDAEIADVVRTRVRAPYPAVPGRSAGARLDVGSSTFRIEAEGVVAGGPSRRVVAVVQRRAARAGLSCRRRRDPSRARLARGRGR